ncbi:SprT-like family protein [Helicosporidium sp. ATCC 50920]|nr:SprT-like family protein [Helicosporidium sp. ATCC 50920]|eukprot:KDD74827.1 SprT-like family protein [Helicosporidium sp. ATCC 50920]
MKRHARFSHSRFVVLSDDESDDESGDEREQGGETRASRLPRAIYASSSSSEDSNSASSDASSGDFYPSDADSLSPPLRSNAPRRAPTPPKEMPHATFRKRREELARELYAALNASIFDSRLPADLPISWNSRLITTAGLTHFKVAGPGAAETAEASGSLSGASRGSLPAPSRRASIELSARVLDAESKLRSTLCHEMCHAAAWVLDGVAKPPHGPHWRAWARRAQRIDPGMQVNTCHSYDIFFAHRWQCTFADCLASYGRHSASIDVRRHACGKCRAPLQYLGRFQRDGTPAKARGPTPFGLFVKQRFAMVKATMTPGSKHADVMRALSQEWALQGKPSASKDASLVESLAARTKTEAGDGLIPAMPLAGAAPNSTSLLLQSIVDLSLSD